MQLTAEQESVLLDLAKSAIVFHLSGGGAPDVTISDKTLEQPAGCFVSLHRSLDHALRGCVGRMEAVRPLTQVVRDTALSVLSDPRFTDHPVTLSELPQLQIDISVLSPLRPTAHPMDFEPLTDGIHLTIAGRSGVFLPQVARDTGWTREQLLTRLCTEKLGLPADAWQLPEAKLRVFSTTILGPVPFYAPRTN